MTQKVTSGVYALYYKKNLVYIGESSNIFLRIGQHIKENRKLFDSFEFYETPDRKRLEGLLIWVFDPAYNISPGIPCSCDIALFSEIAQEFGKGYTVKQIVNLYNRKDDDNA